ncbi:MAG: hypothetical protein GWM98_21250, partial [Nitrospinaceae bacterium]|nr:hypothetical protein [Nitrospinaceae bacterium]NIR56529.1 hypothetical protein [Nitrospinaceae bacterium]NIS86986.1 hypothetical protein [Nitrospinaceae bacterium]NIT83830.1 hypothetical protein [Nitrospinaceae bacterium]NIU46036.1 hypothetical protein [Nitrospinaceae bacterium]
VKRGKALSIPIPKFPHDPGYIRFRSWTALLYLEGQIPHEIRLNERILFLDKEADRCGVERIPVKSRVCLKNPTPVSLLNLAIVCGWTGQEVFGCRELPAGRFLRMEILREGSYTIHYTPGFTQTTLHRDIRVIAAAPPSSKKAPNFHPSLIPGF